jgi:hypothetical protein
MAIVEDIVEGIEDILQSVLDQGLAKLLEVLISGFTLVFSAPTITLATLFNDKPGFVDPLLMPPAECYEAPFELGTITSDGLLDVVTSDFDLKYTPTGVLICTVSNFNMGTGFDKGLTTTVSPFSLT